LGTTSTTAIILVIPGNRKIRIIVTRTEDLTKLNIDKDTSADRVLISREFFYFGKTAPHVTPVLLEVLGFQNRIGHRVFPEEQCKALLDWIRTHKQDRNMIADDPFDFEESTKRYSGRGSGLR